MCCCTKGSPGKEGEQASFSMASILFIWPSTHINGMKYSSAYNVLYSLCTTAEVIYRVKLIQSYNNDVIHLVLMTGMSSE